MARPISEEKKRENTRKNLELRLKTNGKIAPIFADKIDEYMSFYDNLKTINEYLKKLETDVNLNIKAYKETVSEKRRVTSEMRNILTYLGIKPDAGEGGTAPEEL